jgi:hypothetical protein
MTERRLAPLPWGIDESQMDSELLERLDLISKRIERLTGFTVKRNDPAAADFLMSILAGQFIWNDIDERYEVLARQQAESMNQALQEMRALCTQITRARDEVRQTTAHVALAFRTQLERDTYGPHGRLTFKGLLMNTLTNAERRCWAMEGSAVAMLQKAATAAAATAEKTSVASIGRAVEGQLQVHGAKAVQGLNAVVERAERAAARMEGAATKATRQVEAVLAPRPGPLRSAWLWLQHTLGTPSAVAVCGLGAVGMLVVGARLVH